jgi:quinol monooxygenase YgiN
MSDQNSSTPTGAFVVIAEFGIAPANHAAFLEACRHDGNGSVRDEPGCRQFDVLSDDETPDAVILFEVYDDKAAFDAHLLTPHYAVFADAVAALGATKTRVRFLSRTHQGGV